MSPSRRVVGAVPRTVTAVGPVVFGLVCAGTALFGTAFSGIGLHTARVDAAPAGLGLVAETFNVDPAASIDLTLSLPSTNLLATTDFTVTVTAFRAVTTRGAVADAINGKLPRIADSVDVPSTAVQRPAANELRVLVPVEVATRTPAALQLAKPGLYPLTIEVQVAGDVVADLTTFVHRLPSAQETPETPMAVAVATSTDVAVQLDAQAHVTFGDSVVRELTTLADLLEASAVPVSVRVPPAAAVGGRRRWARRRSAHRPSHPGDAATQPPVRPGDPVGPLCGRSRGTAGDLHPVAPRR